MRALLLSFAAVLGACTPQQAAVAPTGPETVSVEVSSQSDSEAQRLCGSPARPETVHHETNVVTYRCLRAS